ncbi:NAD(P)/FAD-dependent oxidoreductase [Desulfosarcina cetonica]|uniref:NAD(P)/FAD-dependent oxidoreductase n=1 Tax=Desulfosarcina cetonica TaxID=90730 RepID=UPI000A5775CC|nr:NAD(P)/FAD-dependent oxidoreductase [Desulfosarcina cetonica]
MLRTIADVAEKYGAQAIKLTGATRMTIVGLKEEDIDGVWNDLQLDKGAAVGLCVRSVRACPGTTFCRLGKQDALGMGMALDKKYHSMELPGKFKMSVSGCHLACSESWVRDIGLIGQKEGWQMVIGGNVGAEPRIAQELVNGLDDQQVMTAIEKTIQYYIANANKGERLGKVINRLGLKPFQDALV